VLNKAYIWAVIVAGIVLLPFSRNIVCAEGIQRLSLEESVRLALKNSLVLNAVQESTKEAEARKKEAFSAFLPQFSTNYSYTRLNEPPSFNFPGLPPLIPPSTMITGTKDNYNWALELKQPLFAGGAIKTGYEIGLIGEEIARSNVQTVQADVIREVKTAYFRVLKAERILDVAKQSVEGLQAHRDQAQSFFDHGLIPRNDLLAAEVELANGHQFLLRAQNGVGLAKAGMNTILRREIDAPLELDDILEYRPFEQTWDDCLKKALDNRPEIKGCNFQLEKAKKDIKQAQSEFLPTVSFLGNYSRYGDEPDVSGSTYQNQESWYLTVVANWNVWEGGRSKSRLNASLSREKQVKDSCQNVQERIILELKEAYLHVREAEQQIPTAKKAVIQAEENRRITNERYREQVARASDVIDAQTILTRAQSDYFNALGDYHISLADLGRAMGVEI